MSESTKRYAVDLTRLDTAVYRATNSAGASIEFGSDEGLLSPVELLLAAIAGCSAVDVDVVTSRRAEPDSFDVHVEGDRVNEDGHRACRRFAWGSIYRSRIRQRVTKLAGSWTT